MLGKDPGPKPLREAAPEVQRDSGTLSSPELRPRMAAAMVERSSLVARLLSTSEPLVLVSAPAGSGKTALLIQWADKDPRPHAWLQLNDVHNARLALVDDLASVLNEITTIDPAIHRWTHLSSPPLRERILPSLRSSLAESPPFLLILDDAHFVGAKDSWKIIETLFDAFPAGARLAIGTRAGPTLPLARLRAAACLLQLGADDLVFDLDETERLISMRRRKAEAGAPAALHAATEGWAAGLSLALLACGNECTCEWIATLDGRQGGIARYLTTEVLDLQGPAVRDFLLETSILSKLSDSSCRAVTGRTDSGALLARLSRDNVFLSPLDDKQEWYRYHHLFAELLQAELARRDGNTVPALHARAAVWSEENGDLEQAVRHWLAAGEVKRAGDVVCRGHQLYSTHGHADTVGRWLECFTLEQITSHIQLSVVAGMVRAMSRKDSHPEWTAAALNAATDKEPPDSEGDATRVWQVLCRAFLAPDGASRMLEDAELCVQLGADFHPAWRAPAYVYLAGARWLTGQMVGAEEALHRAIRDARDVNFSAEIAAHSYLSLLLADQGRWNEAENESLLARRRLRESELGMDELSVTVPLAEARVAAHSGTPVSEEDLASIETDLEDFRLPRWIELLVCFSMAVVALSLAELTRAQRWTTHCEDILKEWPDAGVMSVRVEQLRRDLLERRDVEPLTPTEERVLDYLATHLNLPEIAGKLVVSRNTLKTHVRDLYRKLGVHSRTEAVEQARTVGLLRR